MNNCSDFKDKLRYTDTHKTFITEDGQRKNFSKVKANVWCIEYNKFSKWSKQVTQSKNQ